MNRAVPAFCLGIGACFLCSCVMGRPFWYSPFELAKVSGGPVWRYRALPYSPIAMQFKTGDTVLVQGAGIESADVAGQAKEKEFGAWRVKEVYPDHAVFRATRDATVDAPFGDFLISAPCASEGTVRWSWLGQHLSGRGNDIPGPASIR